MATAITNNDSSGATFPDTNAYETGYNFDSLEWTLIEKDLVDEAWDIAEAWENYRAVFGNRRSFDAIKRRWYRAHPKVNPLDILEAWMPFGLEGGEDAHSIEAFIQELRKDSLAVMVRGKKEGWWKP